MDRTCCVCDADLAPGTQWAYTGDDSYLCETCAVESCDHGDIDYDDRCCLECGADLSEELAGQAEDLSDLAMDR